MTDTLNYIIIIIVLVLGYMIYKSQESLSVNKINNNGISSSKQITAYDDHLCGICLNTFDSADMCVSLKCNYR